MAMTVRAVLSALLCLLCATATADADVRLEATIDTARPFVQAQVRYTVRLYQAISLDQLEFQGPGAPFAEVHELGAPRIRETELDGRRYRITERDYAIFPFASGKLTLAPAQISAQARGQPLTATAPSTVLDVRPAPPNSAPWLPARAVALTEEPLPGSPLRAGEPVRRTVRIEAIGLEAAQLPPIEMASADFSAHPLPPVLSNRRTPEGIIGQREQTWLITPHRPGPLMLPAIALGWHDTHHDRPARAELPPRTLNVLGPLPATTPEARFSAAPPREAPTRTQAPATSTPIATAGLLLLTAAALLGGITALRRHRRNAPLRAALRACRSNDPRAAHHAVLAWGRQLAPHLPPNLGALGHHLRDAPLANELARLDQACFGAIAPWKGRTLHDALRRHAKRKIAPR